MAARYFFNGKFVYVAHLVNCAQVLLNTALLALDGYGISAAMAAALAALSNACTLFFIIECAVKVIGLSFGSYIKDGWNAFDFTIVMTSLLDLGELRATS